MLRNKSFYGLLNGNMLVDNLEVLEELFAKSKMLIVFIVKMKK